MVPLQSEYYALEGLAGLLDTLSLSNENSTRASRSRAFCSPCSTGATVSPGRSRTRSGRTSRRLGLSPPSSAQRPRLSEEPEPRHASPDLRSGLAPARRPTSSSPRRWPRVAERPRGMGRGLSAILSPIEGGETLPELRRLPVELIARNPRQPHQTLRRGGPAGALGVRPRAWRDPARAGPALPRRHV